MINYCFNIVRASVARSLQRSDLAFDLHHSHGKAQGNLGTCRTLRLHSVQKNALKKMLFLVSRGWCVFCFASTSEKQNKNQKVHYRKNLQAGIFMLRFPQFLFATDKYIKIYLDTKCGRWRKETVNDGGHQLL